MAFSTAQFGHRSSIPASAGIGLRAEHLSDLRRGKQIRSWRLEEGPHAGGPAVLDSTLSCLAPTLRSLPMYRIMLLLFLLVPSWANAALSQPCRLGRLVEKTRAADQRRRSLAVRLFGRAERPRRAQGLYGCARSGEPDGVRRLVQGPAVGLSDQ
jgi:hypothetical protein